MLEARHIIRYLIVRDVSISPSYLRIWVPILHSKRLNFLHVIHMSLITNMIGIQKYTGARAPPGY